MFSAPAVGGTTLPTVPGIPGPYRFFFYSFDCNEPRHVHVRRDRAVCKSRLDPVILGYTNGLSAKHLNRIREIILANADRFREAWNEHCGESRTSHRRAQSD